VQTETEETVAYRETFKPGTACCLFERRYQSVKRFRHWSWIIDDCKFWILAFKQYRL